MSKITKLTILDEVNVKFSDLDVLTRREMVKELRFFLPWAVHLPSYKLGRWDGTISYCSIGGKTNINFLDKILPIIKKNGYKIIIEDLRRPATFSFGQVDKNIVSGNSWPKGHELSNTPIVLRDYQVKAINIFLKNNQCLQELPTGSGKTIILSVLSKLIEKYGRSIVIVPNKSLVKQTEEDYKALSLNVGVFYGDRKEYQKQHTICTWQSLNILDKKSKKEPDEDFINDFLKDVVCVIVDECLDPNTLILTDTGNKKISNILEGECVWTSNVDKKSFSLNKVIKVHKNLTSLKKHSMYRLTTSYGDKINITGNHKILSSNGWKHVYEIKVNDEILIGKRPEVDSIQKAIIIKKEIIQASNEVYNLHIENNHNYIANNLIVANCHQAKADVLKRLLGGPFSNCPIRWGLTGTIPKNDFEFYSLLGSIGEIKNRLTAHTLQDKKVLANCKVNIVQRKDPSVFLSYAEEYKYLAENKHHLNYLKSLVDSISKTGNTLILVNRIFTGEKLEELINDSIFIKGSMKVDDRKTHFDEVKTSKNKIIIATYGVASIGIDIPRIFNLVLLESGKSFIRVIQSIGRGIRKAKDKDYVNIWDVCSSTKYSKRHLTTRKKYYREAKYPFKIYKSDLFNYNKKEPWK